MSESPLAPSLSLNRASGVARDPQEGLGVRPGGGCLYLNGKEGEKIKIDIPYHGQFNASTLFCFIAKSGGASESLC